MKRASTLAVVVVGVAAAVLLVLVLAPLASPSPDGLEKVAADTGIGAAATDSATAGGPFADYGVRGVDNAWVATWIAGLLGVVATFAVCAGLILAVRHARQPSRRSAPVANPG